MGGGAPNTQHSSRGRVSQMDDVHFFSNEATFSSQRTETTPNDEVPSGLMVVSSSLCVASFVLEKHGTRHAARDSAEQRDNERPPDAGRRMTTERQNEATKQKQRANVAIGIMESFSTSEYRL